MGMVPMKELGWKLGGRFSSDSIGTLNHAVGKCVQHLISFLGYFIIKEQDLTLKNAT